MVGVSRTILNYNEFDLLIDSSLGMMQNIFLLEAYI